MDKNVHPVAAFAVIVISVLAIATWLWGMGEAREYGGPAGLSVDPQGHLYIHVQNQLIEHDAEGRFVARHDLSKLGVHVLLGGTAFFSDGDLLLRRGPDTRSFLDNVRAFQRLTNETSLVPDAPDTGLHRCDLDTGECSAFGEQPLDFKSTISITIDWNSDDVYISDTSRHLVRKYDWQGTAITPPAAGFHFPNQLLIHEGRLLVADTNHHRIRIVEPGTDDFGQEIASAHVVPIVAADKGHRWPSHLVRVGDEWWVNVMSTEMNYGGIYAFDEQWQYRRSIELPGEADPIALRTFNGEVLISDWYGDRVHRVSPDGRVLGDFESEGLAEVLAESEAERIVYRTYAWLAAAVAMALIVIIVIKGTEWSARRPADGDGDFPADPGEPLLLKPDPDNVRKLKSNIRLGRWTMMLLLIIFPVLVFIADRPDDRWNLAIGGIGFLALFLLVDWMVRVNSATSIRFDGDRVTLRNHRGESVRSALSKVFFTDTIVASGNIAVFLGQGQNPIYDTKRVLAELGRRLPASQRISQWAMQKKLIAMRHPITLIGMATIAMLGVLGAAIWLQ